MKFTDLFKRKKKQPTKTGEFASFFLHATEKEKIAAIRKAAEESNQDQRAMYARARMQLKTQE